MIQRKPRYDKINAALSSAILFFVVNTEHRLTALETKINAPRTMEQSEKRPICAPVIKDSFAAPRRPGACSGKLTSPSVMAARGDK